MATTFITTAGVTATSTAGPVVRCTLCGDFITAARGRRYRISGAHKIVGARLEVVTVCVDCECHGAWRYWRCANL